MSRKTPRRLEVAESTAIVPKVHHQRTLYDTLSTLWARALLIAAGLAVTLAFASVALVLIGPHYTGRAMIQFNFLREESATGAKSLPTATVDAMAVVDSAAPIVRSRALASAVVTRLGLDKDPAFARGSLLWRAFSSVRSILGFEGPVPSNHDLAEGQLMRRIAVASDPRSYVISILVTDVDPESAARLANAVALEYLRGQMVQQLTDSYAAAEREMSNISSIYGIRHPAYQSVQNRLESLRLRLSELREEPFDGTVAGRVAGQSFVAAHPGMIPSGPNILLVLGLAAIVEIGVGAWLALQPWPNGLQRRLLLLGLRKKLWRREPAPAGLSNGFTILSERTLMSVRELMRRGNQRPAGNINGKEVRTTDHLPISRWDTETISQP